MSESITDSPKLRTKAYGVFLAGLVAIVSVVVVTVTHGPTKAVSSTPPVEAAIMPQIADSKSETEIIFRGKSFVSLKRNAVAYHGGVLEKIDVREGQTVKEHDVLGSFNLDRDAMKLVHQVLYPSELLNVKSSINARKMNIERIRESGIPIKKLQLERAEKDLQVARSLAARKMADESSVQDKERDVETCKKQILELKENMEESETELKKLKEDLAFFESKQRRDVELLSWQTNRPYPDTNIPLQKAFFCAPISGKVIFLSPEAKENYEFKPGFLAITVAPVDQMVIRCKVHELDMVKLKLGDPGTVSFDALPDSDYRCTVSRIPGESINPSLEVPADYNIECLIENSDGKVKEGLSCNVKVSVSMGNR